MFSATTDLWTSEHQNIGYICVTLHWIDANFELIHLLIGFEEMIQPHSGANLAVAINLVESSFKPMIYNMYQQYQVNDQEDYAPQVVTTVPSVARTTSRAFLELPPISAESELTGYLQSECELKLFGTDENSTILTWWKSNALTRYPQLSKFARSILAVPATSVPSECTFSTSGRVISEYRSRLNNDTVQAMMLYGDWLKKRPLFNLKF